MKKVLMLCIGMALSLSAIFGQKTLKVIEQDMTGVIIRGAEDNETIVKLQSNVSLNFESTMDKEINVSKIEEENGFFFYYLIFPVEEKYNGRKLIIKSYGYQYHIEPLNLLPKIPVGFFVDGSKSELEGRNLAIQRFSNETRFYMSIFRPENDPMGKQAVTILSTKLASTKKFILLEIPENDKLQEEWQISDYQNLGADYLIKGSIIEFGRKNENVRKKKYQIAYAKISIQLIDVLTGQIVYAEEANGEAKTDGTTTDYDATLNDKAISEVISKLVNSISNLFN